MKITFEKANLAHKEAIFQWLNEPHMKEFWDNTQAHKDDILNFMNGRTQPSPYFNGVFVYWIGSVDGQPFSLIMTGDVNLDEEWPDLWRAYFSKTGKTVTLDFGIGNTAFLGKRLAVPTLKSFIKFYHTTIDPDADTFLIDPDKNNPKASHVYEKAGFMNVGQFTATSGAFQGQQTRLMVKSLMVKRK